MIRIIIIAFMLSSCNHWPILGWHSTTREFRDSLHKIDQFIYRGKIYQNAHPGELKTGQQYKRIGKHFIIVNKNSA